MSTDSRGWRIALTPEALVNPPERLRGRLPNVLELLSAHGYGVLQLPPPGQHGLLLAVIADQVAEYAHHGYATLGLGIRGEPGGGLHWRRLAPLLRHRGVAPPMRHIIRPEQDIDSEAQRLGSLLDSFDLPLEEQRRWRV